MVTLQGRLRLWMVMSRLLTWFLKHGLHALRQIFTINRGVEGYGERVGTHTVPAHGLKARLDSLSCKEASLALLLCRVGLVIYWAASLARASFCPQPIAIDPREPVLRSGVHS